MKFYGDAIFQQDALIKLDNSLGSLPVTAAVGDMVYVNQKVYVAISTTPTWVAVTNVSNLYVHTQGVAADPWTINHNLSTEDIIVEVYDSSDNKILPNEVTITNTNTVTIDFGSTQDGKAIILVGDPAASASFDASVLYDIGGSTLTQPTDGAILMRFVAVRSFDMPINLTGSQATSSVATTSAAAYPIKKNGSSIGTIDYGAAATAGTFTFSSAVSFVAGDVLTVEAPATADATHDGLVWTFLCNTV